MELNLEEIERQEESPFIERFEEFFNLEYKKEIEKILEAYPQEKSLKIDYKVLERFDPLLADELIDNPDAVIEAAHKAIQDVNIPSLNTEEFKPHIRFFNLPKDRELDIRDISSRHLGKIVAVEGLVRQITDVLPKLTLAVWKCKRCGNTYRVPQERHRLVPPGMCECHSRDFDLAEEQSGFIDYQKIQIQEPLEKLKGNEQAVYIDIYVSDDLVNKVSAGDKTKFVGVLRLVPPQKDKKTVYGRFLECNYLEETQKEFLEVDVSKEEEDAIKKLSLDPQIFEKLIGSVAPAIYGHDVVKESIVLQLFGGVAKYLPNSQTIRGNIHVLLIGDPGCLVADERVVLGDGTIQKMSDFGSTHLEQINQQILTGRGGKERDIAKVFHFYPHQKVMEIITESGKSIKGTHNHPLLCVTKENAKVKRIWRRLDEFKVGDKVAVVTSIPCTITKNIPTGFEKLLSKKDPKFDINLPKKVTPELGAFLGYTLGDGWVRKYETNFIVSENEKDLLPKLIKMSENLFGKKPKIKRRLGDGKNVWMNIGSIYSKDIAHNLLFLREKRVPTIIFNSGNKVVREFLKWLFEADGCVFSKGRGNRSISLKAKKIELLRDVQILLLRFSIHSRIVGNNLMIRRGNKIQKFAKEIGFASNKKKKLLKKAVADAESFKRFKSQRSEKVTKIIYHGFEDVFDIEVPKTNRFIANGIISHNTGKSQLLQATNNIAPKSIYVSGKTSSAAGLCVAPDTLVLNDSGFKPIEAFVEDNFIGEGKEEIKGCFSNDFCKETFTLNDDLKIRKGNISKLWRINAPKKMIKLQSRLGKEISLTPNTSLIRIEKGNLKWIKSSKVKVGDYVACARKLPFAKSKKYSINILSANKNIKIANNISKEFKQITDKLIKEKKYPDLMTIAKKIGKSRDTIYAWRNPKFYHGIPLKEFITLGKDAGWNIEKLSSCVSEVFISHGKNVKVPKTINNPKIAYLAGLLIGDGNIREQEKRTVIRLYNTSPEILNKFDGYVKELFGIETEKYTQKEIPVRRFASQIIYPLLKEYGLASNKKENKISHFASESNKEILSALLRGVFDTDGYVSITGSNHIGISTISKPLAQTIQLSLLKFGIISTLRERQLAGRTCIGKNITVHSRNNQFVIEIRSDNKHKFKEIGFCEKNKQTALEKITKKPSLKTNIDKIPLDKLIARKKVYALARFSNDPQLTALANSDIIWEEIVEKKEFKPNYKYVYDFTVDKTHNFIANGFITHNTATAVKDEFGEGGWTLKAGALVLASGGICMADELDKMDPQDRSALHEAMEQGMISIAKAGIVSRFKTDTSLLAGANPKYSRFDKFQPLLEQIDLPASLISRFDLFFMIRDVLDRTMDQKISEHILQTHQSGEKLRNAHKKGRALSKEDKEYIEKITEPKIQDELLRKYIAYARQQCFPILSKEAIDVITNFYVSLRDQGRNQGRYSATARQLEGLVRLSEASARVKLKDIVEIEDAERAILLVKKSLEDTVVDPETGKIDIDIITSGITHTKQNAISVTFRIVKDAMAEGIDMVPIEQIVAEGIEKGLDEEKVMGALADLEKKGDVYKPKHHYIKPTGK